MPSYEIGTGYVSIVPSTRGFIPALEGQLGSQLAGAGSVTGQRVGANVGTGVQAGLAGTGPALGRTGQKIGTTAGAGVQTGLIDRLGKAGPQLNAAGQALTIGVTAPLAGIGIAAFRASIDFESAFAGVRKTVDATAPQLARLRQGIIDMANEVPASREEIAGIAEAAGQLGIATPNILGFTRVMIDLGNSTNLSSDQAADALARLANITQLPQDQFDRLGSTIVDLGNKGASTESEIVEMGLRIAGAGHQIGLSEAQILGFGSALSSVGIDAEAGGSAISRTFIRIEGAVRNGGDELDSFAKVAGVSAAQFRDAYKKDAAGAIVTFIEGLGRIKDEGGNVFGVLDDLGLSEIRVRDALLRASGAGDLFRKSIKTGSDAWRENSALTKEASQRYETSESKLKILSNRFGDAALKLGDALVPTLLQVVEASEPLIDAVGDMARLFGKLPKPVQSVALGFGLFAAGAGPVALVVGRIAPGFAAMKTAMIGLPGFISGVGGALRGLALIVAANPALLALGGVVAVGAFVLAHEDDIRKWGAENIAPKTDPALTAIAASSDALKRGFEEGRAKLLAVVSDPTQTDAARAEALKNLKKLTDSYLKAKRAQTKAFDDEAKRQQRFADNPIGSTIADLGDQAWEGVKNGVDNLGEFLGGAAIDIGHKGEDLISGFIGGLETKSTELNTWVTELPGKVGDWLGDAGTWLWDKGTDAIGGLLSGSQEKAAELSTWVIGLPGKILGWLGDAGSWLLDKGKNAIGGLLGGAKEKAGDLFAWVGGIGSSVLGWLGDAGSWLVDAGKDIMQGLWNGLKERAVDVGNWLKEKAKDFIYYATDPWDIGSPSRVMIDLGRNIMLGLQGGIETNTAGVVSAVDSSVGRMKTAFGALETPTIPDLHAQVQADWVLNTAPAIAPLEAEIRALNPLSFAQLAPMAAAPPSAGGIVIEKGAIEINVIANGGDSREIERTMRELVPRISRDLAEHIRASQRSQGTLSR